METGLYGFCGEKLFRVEISRELLRFEVLRVEQAQGLVGLHGGLFLLALVPSLGSSQDCGIPSLALFTL